MALPFVYWKKLCAEALAPPRRPSSDTSHISQEVHHTGRLAAAPPMAQARKL
jgi:hypothetical protein